MDDTFVAYSNGDECNLYLDILNSLHSSLRFAFQKEFSLALSLLSAIFSCNECILFSDSLNSLHHSLRFTFEKGSSLALPFLNVLVENSPSKFITSICRKPKTNLILTLTHQVLAICFSERLPSELNKIKFFLHTNGYPEHIIKSFMAKTMEAISRSA